LSLDHSVKHAVFVSHVAEVHGSGLIRDFACNWNRGEHREVNLDARPEVCRIILSSVPADGSKPSPCTTVSDDVSTHNGRQTRGCRCVRFLDFALHSSLAILYGSEPDLAPGSDEIRYMEHRLMRGETATADGGRFGISGDRLVALNRGVAAVVSLATTVSRLPQFHRRFTAVLSHAANTDSRV
jgi:hypothetical protein